MDYRLKISGIIEQSIVDGPGLRFVVFTQGCPHKCKGCHNPQTHDFDAGEYADIQKIMTAFDENPILQGMTFSGGEPFCQALALIPLAEEVKKRGKDIYIFSGYYLDDLLEIGKEKPEIIRLLRLCDVIVDGPFIEEMRDIELKYRGSSNQNIINLNTLAL